MTHTSANPLSCSHWGIHTLDYEPEVYAADGDEPVEHRRFVSPDIAFSASLPFIIYGLPSHDLAWLHEAAVSSHDSPKPC